MVYITLIMKLVEGKTYNANQEIHKVLKMKLTTLMMKRIKFGYI